MSICVICGDYLLQSKQINTFLRSLRLQNIIILLKIMKERQIVMDLCTIFAHKVKIGCTLDEKQMEMQTLNKKADATREKDIYRVTVVGSVVNFLLLVFKFFAGIVGHSAAMLADAVHSLSDFITDIIVIVFVRISAKPEDEGHDYGHGKYETLATAIIGIFSVVCGIRHFLERGFLHLPFPARRLSAGTRYTGTGGCIGIHRFQGSALSIYRIQGQEVEFAGGCCQCLASPE